LFLFNKYVHIPVYIYIKKAKQSDKKISANNKAVLKKQYILLVVVSVFYLLIRLTFRRNSIKAKYIYGFFALQIISLICILIMRKMAIVEGANPSVKYAGKFIY